VDGSTVRSHATLDLEITSGVDWFDLHGKADFGGVSAELPELLRALARRETMVQLGDGTFGVLPEEWLQRFGGLAALGTAHNHLLRFHRTQAGLLDALLAAQPAIRIDETFARFREKLRAFGGVRSADQPAGFRGELRHYQKDGLGWMHFLREFDFGGCLADDMGVGKTAQVLALLETRRALRADGETIGPSLVVVPKSLVFNWKQEAERFTPQLRVLDYTGIGRNAKDVALWDLVVTTYGTLRQDAVELSGIEFDYVVLDEAQAIKNASTASAKAARLLRAKHRIAMSGTPVENHIGELWSLFEFLNPGMLGAVSAFKNLRNPDLEQRAMLARALRPFILRRTKEQVAAELPAKTEQTLYCEMEPEQRKLYDELRAHYRNTLLHRVQREGMARSKMHILEALLRLRQAACHPGLIDQKRADGASGKTELLLAQLREVLDEGHKALVFSQFTSLLAILREHLEAERIPYEYLDGATRDRQERVEHFQSDRACPLFLISLKAGGLGLNLTAADYVFLLDPWWNPAIEAQAIDRTHRIGQTKPVFAYRLIARDSIEEKVLELQKTKRDLASAIVTADNSLIGGLQREDLELLLS
jgi:SNF2 family DNA or RNA helicase